MTPDELPWLPISKRVLAVEFDRADDSTRESLCIGLRSIQDPDCEAATRKLAALNEPKRK